MSQDNVADTLAATELFASLSPEEVQRIVDVGRVEYWQQGSMVLEEGAYGPRMMVLVEGDVEILRRDPEGVQREIARVGPGGVLGEMSLLLEMPRTASVRALSDLKVFAMDRKAFSQLVDSGDPAVLRFGLELARALAQRVTTLNDRVVGLLAETNQDGLTEFTKARQELFTLWDF